MALKTNMNSTKEFQQKDRVERNNRLNLNKQLDPTELYDGLAREMYGGENAASKVNSFINVYNKMYKHATGKEKFGANAIQDRMFNQLNFMDKSTQALLQPWIGGRFLFVPGHMPRMMEILHPRETDLMRTYFQSTVTSVSGFTDRTMETSTINALTEANSYDVVTKQTGVTRSITLAFNTLYQGVIKYKYHTVWMQYIYSMGSGAAIYPHLTGLPYGTQNHSMSAIYIIVDPSFQVVEEAALIYAMVPTTNQANVLFDQTWGEHSPKEYQIQYSVHTIYGGIPYVIQMAQAVLADYVATVELHDYWRTPDEDNTFKGILGEAGRKEFDKMQSIINS